MSEAGLPRRAYPLSHGQQAMWLLWELDPASAGYNIALAFWYHTNVDVPAMRRTFQALLDRHPVLRSTFGVAESGPFQEVHDRIEVAFEEIDARGWTDEELEARVAEAYRRPFDLRRGPVARVTLFLRSSDTVLLFAVHHIVSDAWSRGLLISEIDSLYAAEARGAPAALPPLTTQYVDFVEWQSRMLEGPEGREHREYWEGRLAGRLPVLELTTDRPRGRARGRGEAVPLEVGEEMTLRLRELAKAEGVTLFTVLLGAFQVLLSRYTGQEDILVGAPTGGRHRPEFRNVIGYFVNPIVIRGDLSGDPSFRELLSRLRETVRNGLKHADYPFPLLVEALQPERNSTRTPLFQAVFNLFKYSGLHKLDVLGPSRRPGRERPVGGRLGGLEGELFPLVQQLGLFDLVLQLFEVGGVLQGQLRYDADLFDAATMWRMEGHFRTLLEGIVSDPGRRTDPDRPISAVTLMSEAEARLLLTEWNATRRDSHDDRCVPQRVEDQAARAPDAPAVACGPNRLTYRELNRRADRLANALRRRGARPGVLVVVFADRSVEMVIGLLAVLKAGAAYVPLDPAYPRDRLAFMLADTAAPLLLTQESLLERLPRGQARVLCLDRDAELWGGESADPPPRGPCPDDLAYVIYTSGSTGRPKGVEIRHRSLNNLVAWHQRVYQVTPQDRATQLASPAFDASVWELWPYLAAGASVHIPDEETRTSPDRLIRWLASERITLSFLPTPLAEAVLAEPLPDGLVLRALLTGGDRLHRAPGKPLPFRLFNNYGPTENTVVSTWTEVLAQPKSSGPPPIGRPIDNTQAYLLDGHLRPVPIGVPGELYVGGISLARGYLNRPELTAEKFIINPFDASGSTRLYRTGDLCRYRPDGHVDFLGRIDDQVKVRGFRIEPGEIETVLRQHPAVAGAAVVTREAAPGERRLVAYVVPAGSPPSVSELRSRLQQQLPDYMVPSLFGFLEALPLTPSGKVDRRALPDPESLRSNTPEEHVPPRDELEAALARLWAERLRAERVSVEAGFFELGGDSILAAMLINRVQSLMGQYVPVSAIFEAPTVARFAAYLRERFSEAASHLAAGSEAPPAEQHTLPRVPDASAPPAKRESFEL